MRRSAEGQREGHRSRRVGPGVHPGSSSGTGGSSYSGRGWSEQGCSLVHRVEWGWPLRPGNGKCLFLFLPITCCACLSRAGKGELLWETRPCGMGVGIKTTESFLAPANLVTLHSAAVVLSSLCAPLWGHPRWDSTLPILGPGSFPEATLRLRPWGMLVGAAGASLAGRGDRRLDRVGFNLRTELAQSPSPMGRAQGAGKGRRGEGGSQTASLLCFGVPASRMAGLGGLFTGSLSRQL